MLARPHERWAGLCALVLASMAGCHSVIGLDGLQKSAGDDDDGSGGQGGDTTVQANVGPGVTSTSQGAGPPAGCGDGFVDFEFETCDDGGTIAGDGCNEICMRESGWCCEGTPSFCYPGPHKIGGPFRSIPIPDGGFPNAMACMTIPFSIADCGEVIDVDVLLSIEHPFVGDLVVSAKSPSNDIVTLIQQPGLGSPPSGDSSNMQADFPILLDDDAMVSAFDIGADIGDQQVVCQDGAQICSFFPDPEPLFLFGGSNPVGNWELCVGDVNSGDNGSLNGAEFSILTN